MFESAELGHSLSKEDYEREAPRLREALLNAQYDLLKASRFPVIILVSGLDGSGKGETINLLNSWMDPRHIQTNALGEPTDEELERPSMWRFWRVLPPRGRIGIFYYGSWYTHPIALRMKGKTSNAELDAKLDEIVRFEQMLTREGALVLKFWFHLSKKAQKAQFKTLEKDSSTRWRVTATDWKHHALYDKFCKVAERVLRHTSSAEAPWTVVEATDARYRHVTVGRAVLDALTRRLAQTEPPVPPKLPAAAPRVDKLHVLRALDLGASLKKNNYNDTLAELQGRLNRLTRKKGFGKISVIAAFEGMDAAGKGGAIRRVTEALNAREYRVIPVAAPTEEERAQPYLWRFWRHMPGHGRIAIFDRSWYGRVLVERVEGFCAEHDWRRAYGEINDFEEQLTRHGAVLAKFWLQISAEEQLRRFKEREATGFKRFKITPEDWRNRDKWPAYEQAVCDMIDRTSTDIAPWTLVAAEDKRYARIRVLETLCERIEQAL
jgi:polyphosphate:AMP phosphotransferase